MPAWRHLVVELWCLELCRALARRCRQCIVGARKCGPPADLRQQWSVPMRISLCNEVIRELPFERQCAFARASATTGWRSRRSRSARSRTCCRLRQRAHLRSARAEAGVAITGLHYLMLTPEGLSITSGDAAQRARTVEVMRRLCDLAADLGARVLVHGSPAQRTLEPGKEAEGRKWGAECFAAVAGSREQGRRGLLHRAARGPGQSIRAHGGGGRGDRARDCQPGVRTMIDCSAAGRAETKTIPDLLRQWLPTGLIAHVHLNDPNRRGPGEGDLAFAPILRALAAGRIRGRGCGRALRLSARRAIVCRPRHRLRARSDGRRLNLERRSPHRGRPRGIGQPDRFTFDARPTRKSAAVGPAGKPTSATGLQAFAGTRKTAQTVGQTSP